MIAALWKYQRVPLLLGLISIVLYYLFAYQLDRSNFNLLIGLYALLFVSFIIIVKKGKNDFLFLAGLAILFRLIFILVIPNLSQDFYRFIWDGRMLLQGMNPYLSTPESFIQTGNYNIIAQAQALYAGMGELNGSHFTNYPPINQLLFAIAALFSGKSILGAAIALRGVIIIAEIGIIVLGKKLLQRLGLPIYHIFWFSLNPFIIIEMTGNLHFESVMLFFVIASIYFLVKGKWIWSAVLLAISVSVKLLPLLFLPLVLQFMLAQQHNQLTQNIFLNWKGWWLAIRYYLLVIVAVIATFAPFLTGSFAENFGASIALWFQKFEFNASIYYLIRWYGYQTIGWNIIADVGPKLPLIVIGFLALIGLFRKNKTPITMISAMVLGVSFYFLLSTTVHPWYVATPLLLCVFTKYRFPLVWSATIMLSYSAYTATGFQENLWLVAIEYSVVIGFFIWEVFQKGQDPSVNLSTK